MVNLNVNNLIFVFHQTENTPEKAKKQYDFQKEIKFLKLFCYITRKLILHKNKNINKTKENRYNQKPKNSKKQ